MNSLFTIRYEISSGEEKTGSEISRESGGLGWSSWRKFNHGLMEDWFIGHRGFEIATFLFFFWFEDIRDLGPSSRIIAFMFMHMQMSE